MLVASSLKHSKCSPKSEEGADIALNMINKRYGIECDLKVFNDDDRKTGRHEQSLSVPY